MASRRSPPPTLVALCEKDPRGGALAAQIDRARVAAGAGPCVLVRSASFPVDPATMASQRVSAVLDAGGRAVVVTDTDWRHMVALQVFHHKFGHDAAMYRAFLQAETPLRRLASLRRMLGLDPAAAALRRRAPEAARHGRTQDDSLICGSEV